MLQLTESQKVAAIEMARESLYHFIRLMFFYRKGFKWLHNWHHEEICDKLMEVEKGETTRLIINVPPRYSKTEIVVVGFSAWCMGRHPDAEFIHTSYSGTLATNNSWQIREMVQSELYREIFPEAAVRHDSKARNEWRTTKNGVFYATGAGGTITGYGAGKHREEFGGAILIDDPHKADEAHSDTVREGVLEWYQNTLESRQNYPGKTPIILIMQRLHERDLAGWLLDGGNGEKWERLILPAIGDGDVPLWPAKHSLEMLQQMQTAKPYVFAGQYQQRPSPLGGGLLKGAWLQRYRVLPNMTYRKIFADTAQKTKEHNDYSVFQCWGKGVDGNAYLIDQIRGKWEAPELKRRATDFWNKHLATDPVLYGGLRAMAIEDKSSGTGLIQDLKTSSSIPVVAVPREKDKLTRVMDIASYVEAGRVFIPEEAPWVGDFVHECESFTPNDTHAHDDQVDPMCDAINDMVATGNVVDLWSRMAG